MPTLSAEERRLAEAALRKRREGKAPSRDEARALKKFEKEHEESLRWKHYASIPKRHWQEMSGRQVKVLNEQAARYGAPIGSSTISLPDFVRWFHDFLADHAGVLALEGDEESLAGPASPALERCREENHRILRLRRLELEKQLLPRSLVHDALMKIAAIIRQAGEQLDRRGQADAVELLTEAIDSFSRRVEELFAAAPLVDDDGPLPLDPESP